MKIFLIFIVGVIVFIFLFYGIVSVFVRCDLVVYYIEKVKVGLIFGLWIERFEIFIICMYVLVLYLWCFLC